jgi:hypothetical protein
MGMRDESWCSSCGKSQPYSEDEIQCGECVSDQSNIDSTKLIEYMKLHLISLEQDSVELDKQLDSIEDMDSDEYKALEIEDIFNNGQLAATAHLLSVAHDILGTQTKGK